MDALALLRNAVTLHRQGRLQAACDLYGRVLALRPDLAEAALLLGLAGLELEDFDAAEAAFARAVALAPQDAEAHHGLGAARLALGRPAEAEADQRRAVALAPGCAPAWDGLGGALLAQDRPEEAMAAYAQALALIPDHDPEQIGTLNNLGAACKAAGRPAEALAHYDRVLALRPDDPDIRCNRANAALDLGDAAAALADFQAACAADPEHAAARWGACFARLPVGFEAEADIAPARAAYAEALAGLEAWLDADPARQIRAADQAAGNLQPFYLTYQGQNDRPLQARYGALLARVMAARHPDLARPPAPRRPGRAPGDRLRVGVCSAFFHEHSVWKIPTRGWLAGLDRKRFAVTGLYCGAPQDACTEEARALCDDFVHEPGNLERLVRAARERELDAVLFPEVGMAPLTARAAALRLAPVQAVGLGHPMTTGLPTMDYFLSCDCMEPETGAEAWYTERLVRLPGASLWYEPIRRAAPPLTRADFGLPEDAVLLFSPQSLFKYLPRHDAFFPRTAAAAGAGADGVRCVFVFVEHRRAARLTARFRARLERAFAAAGLAPDRHMVLLPHQPPERYRALTACCDAFLDSLGWSGFNTAMEAAEAGLPMLTCPGDCLRARHALAVVRGLGLDDAVAADPDQYVAMAARLARDRAWRADLAERVRAAAPRLWRDAAPIRALEAWLEAAVAEAAGRV